MFRSLSETWGASVPPNMSVVHRHSRWQWSNLPRQSSRPLLLARPSACPRRRAIRTLLPNL